MLMADTMAIFFVILGLLLAFPGLWLLCRGLWPQVVTNAGDVCASGLIKPFLIGLPITAAMLFSAAALGSAGAPGKISAAAVVCFYLMIANSGVAGLVTGSARASCRQAMPTNRGGRRCAAGSCWNWRFYCRSWAGS